MNSHGRPRSENTIFYKALDNRMFADVRREPGFTVLKVGMKVGMKLAWCC